MIKQEEIRLGNWFEHNNKWSYKDLNNPYIFQWDTIDWYAISECTLFPENIEPIPITDRWLSALGFIRDKDDILCIDYPSIACSFYWIKDFLQVANGYTPISNYKHIKYVHQLQNLYYALTGLELVNNG